MTVTSCGSLGYMLGGYNVFGKDAYLEKTFDMSSFSAQGIAHASAPVLKPWSTMALLA